MRDHSLCGKFFDFHSRGPFSERSGPHGCGSHVHGHHGHGPHGHGGHGHGPHGHGPCGHGHGKFRHGPHHHGPHGGHGNHGHFDFFGPRGSLWKKFKHFGRSERPGHCGRPVPGFFKRGDFHDRRGGCGFRRREYGRGKNSEEQTFLFRGVVIGQDKRAKSV